VIGSGLVRTGGNDFGGLKHFGDEHLADKLGRSRAQRRKRKVEEREAEEALVRLVDRGSMGGKYLAAAERYEAAKRSEESKGSKGSGLENSTGSKRSIVQTKQGKPGEREKRKSRSGQCGVEDESEMNPTSKRPFSAMAIKRIGFDPTQGQRADDGGDRERRGTISQLKESGREFEGTKKVVRRNVRPPPSPGTVPGREEVLEGDEMVDLD
jgi:minichromosome maintenance protein 10